MSSNDKGLEISQTTWKGLIASKITDISGSDRSSEENSSQSSAVKNVPTAPVQTKRKRKAPPREGPARPLTAYNFFFREMKDHVSGINMATIIGQKWRDLQPENRKPYEDLAREDSKRFEKETAWFQKKKKAMLTWNPPSDSDSSRASTLSAAAVRLQGNLQRATDAQQRGSSGKGSDKIVVSKEVLFNLGTKTIHLVDAHMKQQHALTQVSDALNSILEASNPGGSIASNKGSGPPTTLSQDVETSSMRNSEQLSQQLMKFLQASSGSSTNASSHTLGSNQETPTAASNTEQVSQLVNILQGGANSQQQQQQGAAVASALEQLLSQEQSMDQKEQSAASTTNMWNANDATKESNELTGAHQLLLNLLNGS